MMRISRSTASQRLSVGLRIDDFEYSELFVMFELMEEAIRRWHSGHKVTNVVSNNTQFKQCSIGTKEPQNVLPSIIPPVVSTADTRQKDPRFHFVYTKF